ncbi:glycosyltransferase family 2 protein [Gryllotalpicola ginsengisoli]|uniref:glycosyltransferase family 2 protein n=1 Tax=Gryllotalpicola ginsengisoli TaxID=444608 RepID=UPI0003B484E7|nr:glycosyltransferase [Gryllotalpicola ginsengisoli]
MLQRVTAILVVRSGSTHVQRTLDSLAAQTRRPDSVVVIDVASTGDADPAISAFRPTQYLATKEKLSFAAATAAAVRAIEPPSSEGEWLWLLAQDTAPEPAALEHLLAMVEVSPSVAVAGPKIVDWEDRSFLRQFGVSMTRFGATVPIVEDELDQAQHDGLSDVLGVPEAGMLVRHTVWNQVGGLDEGLPVVDGGLDFCVRARLAGHRVVVAPDARVAFAGDGIVGPRISRRTGAMKVGFRARRAAQLHRRLAYAPGWALVVHWLSLVPLAVLRSLGWLLAKQPGAIGGELAAAFAVAFGAGGIGEARRRLKLARRVGWSAIAPLRVPVGEVRRRRALAREAAITAMGGERHDIDFFGTGGGWVVLAALVASVALQARLLGADAIGGGGLLPLPDSVSALWSGIGWGWRDVGVGFAGPSDPFNAVLAVLGSLTFWNPSLSLVLLWFGAMPLAALGAWLLAARLTYRGGLRAVFALAWAFAPPLLAALAAGRPAAVLAHVLLPWLMLACVAARRSWAGAGAASLLAAAVAACTPSLIPALAAAWLVWTAVSGRGAVRALAVPIPTVALFLPLALVQIGAGHPLRIFADPGVPVAGSKSAVWQLLLGFPGGTDGGWHELGEALGWSDGASTTLLAVLIAPIVVLALVALFLRGTLRAAAAVFGALLGLATALVASHVALQHSGAETVSLWTGSGLSLYWLGLISAACLALVSLGRFSSAPAWVAAVAVLVAIVPLSLSSSLGRAAVTAGEAGQLPAYVMASAGQDPRMATLVISPIGDGALTASVVHGTGTTLIGQSTLASTNTDGGADDGRLATLAANLASLGGYDADSALKHYGISFVFVESGTGDAPAALARRAAVALNANPLFVEVGTTTTGTLWSTAEDVPSAQIPAAAGGWQAPLVRLMLIVVFGAAVLLSVPTGRLGEAQGRGLGRMPRSKTEDDPGTEPADPAETPIADEPIDEPALSPEELEPAYAGVAPDYDAEESEIR